MTLASPGRDRIRACHFRDEGALIAELVADAAIAPETRAAATARAVEWVRTIRAASHPGLMEAFLAEYGLSTDEGVALMCLAEALLRVPDAETIDALIEDKIAPSQWARHLGRSSSPLVNASTWALMLTGKVLQEGEGVAEVLKGAIRRLGEPVIRAAVARAMREMGAQFVLGQTIGEALTRAREDVARGYTHSYDMLGEAARTAADAEAYFRSYETAIEAISAEAGGGAEVVSAPGISVKLSALHPRYEETQKDRVMAELVPRVAHLARIAAAANIGFNIDAEEADRLELSLDVIEAVLDEPELSGWEGFGVVVQAYGRRASPLLDWLHELARARGQRLMVRLVKGAYWDSEIKRAQVEGLPGFPVFTRKVSTDVSYLACAARLLRMADRLYPQFATHNAHTVATVLELAGDRRDFEFQRLHGMGAALHDLVMREAGTRCRIYAPVGRHRDLLAYLVRRLLENGANSSFVHRIVDESVPPEEVCADPFEHPRLGTPNPAVTPPEALFAPERVNSRGHDLYDRAEMARIEAARAPFATARWRAAPILATGTAEGRPPQPVENPARPGDSPGEVIEATPADAARALAAARPWRASPARRAEVLNRAADLYEEHFGEFYALCAREAGKTLLDAVAELREAVDFLRYYAARGRELEAPPRGRIVAISPWNFPLAIFTGQIAGALAAGNAVIAKPAETTPLIAHRAVELLHRAGVPRPALQFLPGAGAEIGARLVADARTNGVVFTGSTATARRIAQGLAEAAEPDALLIAETGGLNAMVVDSTALPEQAVRDIVTSAFRSAGQRCSALRMLYLQRDVADDILEMLTGAMDELRLGDPWEPATDVGPVITAAARADILAHIEAARAEGRILHELAAPPEGHFVAPTLIDLPGGIADLEREVFGPVLHVARFAAEELESVVEAINARGYGLTFGMHSRIDDRVEAVTSRLRVGNLYINRNQIGAVVGSQPFGGEGLSGTGPKAGGPHYVERLAASPTVTMAPVAGAQAEPSAVQALIDAARPEPGPIASFDMPGPTGESNRLSLHGRGVVLCLGPTARAAEIQARAARAAGAAAVLVAPGVRGPGALDGLLDRAALTTLSGIAAVALWSDEADMRAAARALAARKGPIVPLVSARDPGPWSMVERHLCIDTTASGGNARLLAAAGDD
jgi:RHH-type proline utilization regulon transcriptional repressor/proline dehydrogenase/delta 1-pyrroline-5-carboxylate dehydrogenase